MTSQRRQNLDGLRTVAVFLVLLHHTSSNTGSSSFFHSFMLTGWNGIYLFLILSGFLIGTVLLKEIDQTHSLSLKNFWGRRVLRTWPVYFILLGFNFLRSDISFQQLIPYLTFTQNLFDRPIYVVTWSLAAQEQFYFLLPLFLLAMVRINWIRTQFFSRLIWIGIFLGLFGIYWQGDIVRLGALAPLLLGVWIADLELHSNSFLQKLKQKCNELFVLGVVLVYAPFLLMEHLAILYFQVIGFACIVIACLSPHLRLAPVLNSRFMLWCAQVSYSAYLFQDRPLYRVDQLASYLKLSGSSEFYFVLLGSIASTLGCGWVLFQIFEKPFMKLRNHWFPSQV